MESAEKKSFKDFALHDLRYWILGTGFMLVIIVELKSKLHNPSKSPQVWISYSLLAVCIINVFIKIRTWSKERNNIAISENKQICQNSGTHSDKNSDLKQIYQKPDSAKQKLTSALAGCNNKTAFSNQKSSANPNSSAKSSSSANQNSNQNSKQNPIPLQNSDSNENYINTSISNIQDALSSHSNLSMSSVSTSSSYPSTFETIFESKITNDNNANNGSISAGVPGRTNKNNNNAKQSKLSKTASNFSLKSNNSFSIISGKSSFAKLNYKMKKNLKSTSVNPKLSSFGSELLDEFRKKNNSKVDKDGNVVGKDSNVESMGSIV